MSAKDHRIHLLLASGKYIVYFHLVRMECRLGKALSRYLEHGFSSACSLRSSYANGDRSWG